MTMLRWLPLLLLLTACGGGEPTGPSPVPTPTPAPIVQPDPVRFDAAFNAQLVHDAFDNPANAAQRAKLLPSSPSIYLQSDGLSSATVAAMEAEARAIVPMLTGGRLSVGAFESGPGARAQMVGWIVVEQVNEPGDNHCGRASIGAAAGHIWLNMAFGDRCNPLAPVFGHELGHALGFYHVADQACLMYSQRTLANNGLPCDKEQYHASLAYQSNGAYGAEQRVIVVD